jgi:hypothetical protein
VGGPCLLVGDPFLHPLTLDDVTELIPEGDDRGSEDADRQPGERRLDDRHVGLERGGDPADRRTERESPR